MNIIDYKKAILTSNSSDWNVIDLDSGFGNPDAHDYTAALKSDLSISISWGRVSNDNFREPWANGFPDEKAHSAFIDFVYNGNLVYRETFVIVDGGRCYMPLFKYVTANGQRTGYSVTQEKLGFYTVFDIFGCQGNLGQYIAQLQAGGTNITVTNNTDWLSG